MKMTKRDFIRGTGFLGMASLAGGPGAATPDKTGAQSSSVFNVRDFDAKGDGTTPDSDALQKAMDAAGAVGGTVYFPAGRYLCHDLKVHPHTTVLAEPQWGYRGEAGAMLRKLSHSVIANNVLYHGFMDRMAVDLGEHGDGYIFVNNVGCPMQ